MPLVVRQKTQTKDKKGVKKGAAPKDVVQKRGGNTAPNKGGGIPNTSPVPFDNPNCRLTLPQTPAPNTAHAPNTTNTNPLPQDSNPAPFRKTAVPKSSLATPHVSPPNGGMVIPQISRTIPNSSINPKLVLPQCRPQPILPNINPIVAAAPNRAGPLPQSRPAPQTIPNPPPPPLPRTNAPLPLPQLANSPQKWIFLPQPMATDPCCGPTHDRPSHPPAPLVADNISRLSRGNTQIGLVSSKPLIPQVEELGTNPLQRSLDRAEQTIGKLEYEQRMLKAEYKALADERNKLMEANFKMKQERDRAMMDMERLKIDYGRAVEECRDLKDKRESLKKEIAGLETEKAKAHAEVRKIEHRLDEAENKARNAVWDKENAVDEVKRAKQDRDRIMERNEKLDQQLEKLEAENVELEEKLSKIRFKMEEMDDGRKSLKLKIDHIDGVVGKREGILKKGGKKGFPTDVTVSTATTNSFGIGTAGTSKKKGMMKLGEPAEVSNVLKKSKSRKGKRGKKGSASRTSASRASASRSKSRRRRPRNRRSRVLRRSGSRRHEDDHSHSSEQSVLTKSMVMK